jgi:hypothetical protein
MKAVVAARGRGVRGAWRRAAPAPWYMAGAAGGRGVGARGMVGSAGVGRRRAGTFSIGLAQRLGLDGALPGDPGDLLLDAPLNRLDREGIARAVNQGSYPEFGACWRRVSTWSEDS